MENVDLEKAKSEVASGSAILMDVRELDEWNEKHLEFARLMPLSELEKGFFPEDIPKDVRIYTYCRRGRRCSAARVILSEAGYSNVVGLSTSYENLVDNGFTSVS